MKHILFIFFTFCYGSLSAQNYYYSLAKQQENTPENATIISNVDQLIAGLKSDENLYVKAGNYKLPNTLYLYDISNLKVTGADGAEISGDLETLLHFRGTTKNIDFNNVKFNSTSNLTSTEYGPGIVYFDGSIEDILFEKCEFTSPQVASNGLKFAAYPTSTSRNIISNKCNFFDIGRMAIETVNHNNDDVPRITDVKVTECNFERLGLQSPYGIAVSLSGSGEHAVISNNKIFDANDIGIENVAWNNVLIENNTFSSENHAYDPISMNRRHGGNLFMTNVIIVGNSGSVSGSGSHMMELNHSDGLLYKQNSINADAINLSYVKNSSFTDNFHTSDGGIGLYVENESSNNTFTNNTFITTRDYASTIVFYPGATANTLQRNEVIKRGVGGHIYNDIDGGNINLDL